MNGLGYSRKYVIRVADVLLVVFAQIFRHVGIGFCQRWLVGKSMPFHCSLFGRSGDAQENQNGTIEPHYILVGQPAHTRADL